jgi:hypothetical protein
MVDTMTMTNGGGGFTAEVRQAVTGRAALLVLGVLALQLLFVASYVGALHRPKPTDVPFAVVGPPRVAQPVAQRLDRLPGGPLDTRVLPDAATAHDQVLNRDIDGALLLNPLGRTDRLLVTTGGGTVLSRVLTQYATRLETDQGRSLTVVDAVPAASGDFNGLSSFYLVVGWCVGGYLCASIMAISAGSRSPNLRRTLIRLAALALVAAVGGLGGAVIVGPILGALPGSVTALWGLGTLVTFAVGAATLAFMGLFGVVGIGLVILLVVVAGNPSAGGALPGPLLPPFWRAIGPALPPGPGTWVARSIAYFRGNAVTAPLLVLSLWAVAGTVITLLTAVFPALRIGSRRSRRAQAAGQAPAASD